MNLCLKKKKHSHGNISIAKISCIKISKKEQFLIMNTQYNNKYFLSRQACNFNISMLDYLDLPCCFFFFVSLCFVLFVLFYLDSQLLLSRYLCCVDNNFLVFLSILSTVFFLIAQLSLSFFVYLESQLSSYSYCKQDVIERKQKYTYLCCCVDNGSCPFIMTIICLK